MLDKSSLPDLVLKSQCERRLKRGHLWIYSNEVDVERSPLKQFTPGQQARVVAHNGRALGIAQVNPNNLICGRLVSRDEHQLLDKSLLVRRVQQALALRQTLFAEPYYRLIYGDADLLPGLVVDRFGDCLVVQIATAGMEVLREEIVTAVQQVLKPSGILLSNEHGARQLESLPAYTEVASGSVPESVELLENDTRFIAPLLAGQKTGWFYDHRVNRARAQILAPGKRVLDVFSYIGSWGVQLARAGAREVVCVDSSTSAIEGVAANATLNGLADRVTCLPGKALEVMKALVADQAQFDMVVLDPPAFIKRRKDQKAGEAAYRHINELAMRLLGRDGLLVSASCSMHLERAHLVDILRGAGRHMDRHVQIIGQGGQGPDHPVHPAIPETEYLKAVFGRVYLP